MADAHFRCVDAGHHVCRDPGPRPWVHPAVEQRDFALERIKRARAVLEAELRDAIWDIHITSLERVRDALTNTSQETP